MMFFGGKKTIKTSFILREDCKSFCELLVKADKRNEPDAENEKYYRHQK